MPNCSAGSNAPSTNLRIDFQALVKSDILPVYRKANVRLIVTQRGPGANVNDVTMATGYAKYADLDGGPLLTKAAWPGLFWKPNNPASDRQKNASPTVPTRNWRPGGTSLRAQRVNPGPALDMSSCQ